jgi:hypothetical protein
MSVPRTVAEVLRRHVTLEVEGIDRMYLNVYQPRLQCEGQVAAFFRSHRGHTFASSALMDPMTKAFIAGVEAFLQENEIPLVLSAKGQRKDDVAREYRAKFRGTEGVLFVGKAQEKTPVFRTEKRKNPKTGQAYPWIVRSTAMVNHFYFHGLDEDFGPFFLKFCTYFPYNATLCLNGHEYVKRQLAKEGIAFEALDNGILSCADPERLQQLCDGLSGARIDALLRKWLARLPHPFTDQDRRAGYRYDVSILQAEFSLTQVLDRPLTGRVFFEEVIRENLDLGRPDQVQLIFGRRVTSRTPGRFRTRVLTAGVTPSLHIDYKRAPQAVPQGGPGPADRDDHQRRARLPPGQAAGEPARLAAGRLPGQPTSAGRPTHQPGLCPRRGRLSPRQRTGDGRRPTGQRLALRGPRRASAAECPAGLSPAAPRVFQPRPARPLGAAPGQGARSTHPGPDDLPPAAPAAARLDRARAPYPPLPGDRQRLADRAVLHPRL